MREVVLSATDKTALSKSYSNAHVFITHFIMINVRKAKNGAKTRVSHCGKGHTSDSNNPA